MEINRIKHITEGVPSQITCSVGVKMSTLPYESIDHFVSMTLQLREDSDPDKAYIEVFEYLEGVLKPRLKAVRDKYPK